MPLPAKNSCPKSSKYSEASANLSFTRKETAPLLAGCSDSQQLHWMPFRGGQPTSSELTCPLVRICGISSSYRKHRSPDASEPRGPRTPPLSEGCNRSLTTSSRIGS